MRRIVLVAALAFSLACPKSARVPACAANETNRCTCGGGTEGLQACLPSGDAFGACVCANRDHQYPAYPPLISFTALLLSTCVSEPNS